MKTNVRVKWIVLFLFALLSVSLFFISTKSKTAYFKSIPLESKITLLSTSFGFAIQGYDKPPGALNSAGYNPGLPQFNIPALQEADSGMGIANPGNLRKGDNATALPSTLLLASTFSQSEALYAGKVLGSEAKDKGFNIVLAGGVNLIREPRGGRNFEYASEDPLLSGIIAGSFIQGIQSENVVSTIKHFAFNSQETGRVIYNAVINEKAARESDLLAFEIANSVGKPGSFMTAYNKVNGQYASENDFLMNKVLKRDWAFQGWIMSDWGGTHSTQNSVLAGLDQQSGYQYDDSHYFGPSLLDLVRNGAVSPKRIDDMFSRIVTTLNLHNAFTENEPLTENDYAQHRAISQKVSEHGIVLLKNEGILPLEKNIKKIYVVGGNADKGVLSGAGASQVIPAGSFLLRTSQGVQVYHSNSIVNALQKVLPSTTVTYLNEENIEAISAIEKNAVVIVVANQWSRETKDQLSLDLTNNQNQLIEQITRISDDVVVLLQTGGPVKMPWKESVKGIVEAWYSGSNGADAIANILVGIVNPSAKLPITFPLSESDLPRPTLRDWNTTTSSPRLPRRGSFDINFNIEGADVGYKWFYKNKKDVLYPFGYGLSYTNFQYDEFVVNNLQDKNYTLHAKIKNTGSSAGIDIPQVYLYGPTGEMKLISWAKIYLSPGQEGIVNFKINPLLLSQYDIDNREWFVYPGKYKICLSKFAGDCSKKKEFTLDKKVTIKYR